MSYCRMGWDGSDVYVYDSSIDGTELYCCGPKIESYEDMIVHLAKHRREGDFVPQYAIEGLWADIPGAKKPVEREPIVMAARKRLAEAVAGMPDFTEAAKEVRRALGKCGECGKEKQAP